MHIGLERIVPNRKEDRGSVWNIFKRKLFLSITCVIKNTGHLNIIKVYFSSVVKIVKRRQLEGKKLYAIHGPDRD